MKNTLYRVDDSGITKVVFYDYEEYGNALDNTDRPHFETFEEAAVFAIESLSERIRQLEEK